MVFRLGVLVGNVGKILNKTISTNGESFTPDNLQLYNLR